ncbi:hypothetical protein GPECTOR_5g419 [Gonium pectorale]|uniref:Uncharacterized protein n=1 Tax=Gonium pectorale TaxID=33097 RepID=A0A150GWR1_GONPE|nr:hypothetical protein GPECTOR_5g419 [Gonium pectorale]|eukprot:KXZ54336.1 hypothetical protein GPECTOR_5g419 [Gonium pectorale]
MGFARRMLHLNTEELLLAEATESMQNAAAVLPKTVVASDTVVISAADVAKALSKDAEATHARLLHIHTDKGHDGAWAMRGDFAEGP